MKKLLTLVVAALMIMTFAVAANAQDISVTLNGEALVFEQAPVIVEGRTLVPLRAIFEALGASVEWDDATKTVTSTKDDITVKLAIGSNVLYKNDEAVELDVPAQIVGAGYTMVPARAIAESFGVLVDWDDSTKTVILVKEETPVVKEEIPEGAIIVVSGETYSSDLGVRGIYNAGPQVVENPDVPGDKVMFMELNVEGQAWNYFWYDCTYVPGQRYLIRFNAKAGTDYYGNYFVADNIVSINVKSNGADKVAGSYKFNSNEWTSVAHIVTIPADIDPSKPMAFGIYSNPAAVDGYEKPLGCNFYLDDVSVVPYEGNLADGLVDVKLLNGSDTSVKEEVKEETPKAPAQKLDMPAGVVLEVSGETFVSDPRFYGSSNPGPAVAENPDEPGDKVLLMKTNVQKKAWNYFWFNCEWVPGQRYLIKFNARPENDCYDNPVAKGNVGVNIHTNGADKGIDNYTLTGDAWSSRAIIYTIPADIDTSKGMKFGIYASPIAVEGYETELAWSFYLDDISIVPYEGELEDGKYDAALFE